MPDTNKNPLIGKAAGSFTVCCPTCDGQAFRLLGPAPAGGLIGDWVPHDKHPVTTAECCACGEHCYPWLSHDRDGRAL